MNSNQSFQKGQFLSCKKRKTALILMLLGVLILAILDMGTVLSFDQTLWKEIIFHLRLPHILAVILVGAGLGLSGAVLQSYLRNPLADPALIGVSSGGSLSTMIFLVMAKTWGWTVSLWGYTGAALLGVFLVLLCLLKLVALIDRLGVAGIILIGIGVNACLGAILGCAMVFLDQAHLDQILMWGLGSFQLPSYGLLSMAFLLILLGLSGLYFIRSDLDKLNFGERSAFSMGVNLQRLRTYVLVAVSLLMAVSVILVGSIAFVGLLAPHFSRHWTGPNSKSLWIGSALCGAIWLLFADLLASFWMEGQLPVGVVSAFLGGPFFIYVLLKKC